jgi:hypothetical protein
MFSETRVWLVATVLALLPCGPFVAASAKAEEDDAALKSRFELLSQHGNVECSAQFEKLIGTMGPEGRLQGSCCAPMDEARYRQQLEGLKKYSDIPQVPPDPYDISAPLAHKLIGDYDLPLNKEEQAAYDYAMEHSDMEGPCCRKSEQRRVLWMVLVINLAMFLIEVGAGLAAGSASLQADALDFLGDAGNYAISLFVVGMALRYRAIAALVKGTTMGLFGLWVVGTLGLAVIVALGKIGCHAVRRFDTA